MKRIGFDNDKYLSMQSAHIREYHREGRKYRENLLKVSIFPNILL